MKNLFAFVLVASFATPFVALRAEELGKATDIKSASRVWTSCSSLQNN